MSKAKPVLELRDIRKSFRQGGEILQVLRGVSLAIAPGEIIAITGESGCGKSTLLQIAGLLDLPDSGQVLINGADTEKLSDQRRTLLRRESLGFVYQYHHLLADFSALENVMLPRIIAGKNRKEALGKAEALLEKLGLSARLRHRPAELSGGEQQRVAIARALANVPALLLADEPTGNLDPATASAVFSLLLEQSRAEKLALLMVTHNIELAAKADRVLRFRDGILHATR